MKQDLGISKRAGVVFQIRCVHPWRFIGALLVLTLVACMPRAASAQVTVLVMPMEHPKDGVVPFGPEDYAKIYPKLRILNSDGEWQHLRIGYHRWLCNELNDVAAKLDSTASENERKELVHLRFLSWDHALDNLTVTYKGKYDVCQVPSTWTAALIDKGILAPYDDFAPGDYPDRLLETCFLYGDKRYHAVPWHIDFRVIYYADRLTTNPDDLLEYKSFEQCLLRRQAQMRSSPDGRWEAPLALGITRNEWDILHNTFNWAFGGRIVERRGRQWVAVFAEAEPAAGVQRLLDLRTRGLIRFVEADKARQEQEWMTLARGLLEGKHDVVLGGPYMRVAFADRADVKAARLPRMVERDDVTFLGGSHLGLTMAKRTPQQEQLARAIIERLTSKGAAISLYQNTDAMPARNDAFEQFLHENPRWAEAFLAARDSGKPYPSIPQWAEEVEVKLGPGLFHNTLVSIAAGRDWKDEVLPNLTKAAEEVTHALYDPWWVKWAIAGGVVAIAVLVVVLIWMWQRSERRARSAVKKSYELMEEAERHSGQLGASQERVEAELSSVRLVLEMLQARFETQDQKEVDRLQVWESVREEILASAESVQYLAEELPDLKTTLSALMHEINVIIVWVEGKTAKEPAVRGPGDKVNAPPGTTWDDVWILIDPPEYDDTDLTKKFVTVVVGRDSRSYCLEEMGFGDKKAHKPNDPWYTLLKFLRFSEGLDYETAEKTPNALEATVSKIRMIVKGLFTLPIPGWPIPKPDPTGKYHLAFHLALKGAIVLDTIPGRSWSEVSVWVDEECGAIAFQRPAVVLDYIGSDPVVKEISKTTKIPWTVLDWTDGEKAFLKQLVVRGKIESGGGAGNARGLNEKLMSIIPGLADEPIAYQDGAWCAVFCRSQVG